jgi:UDP-2-acetamido-2-deoxy-ribo-hexuluronate aminotransferase
MENIQMVDLKNQYKKIKKDIDCAINEVIDSTHFIKGEQVESFANNLQTYLNVKHVIPCGNGTDALQIALMSLNLKPNDEIICPAFTFISSAEVIGLLGYRPVLVDVDYDNFIVTKTNIEQAISVKTKAIIPVHLFGQGADMEEIMKIAKKYDLAVIEDTAQALGCDYTFSDNTTKKLGTIGTIGCTSFFPSKNLGCYGDGGALMTNDDELAEKIKMITNHGSKIKYNHQVLGVNSRLDTLQAAILDVKLKHLDSYIKARQTAANIYNEGLKDIKGIILPKQEKHSTHTFHQYTLKVLNGKRDELKQYLNSNNIPAMIYYPIPLHKQEAFLQIARQGGDLSISEKLANEVLSLPMHTELTNEQQKYIIEKIKEFFI